MNNFKRNIYRTSIEEEPIVENYCVNWSALNNGNIKMSTSGYIDFTEMLGGRTIAFLDGTITGYVIAGLGTFSCEIPMTHTTSKASWSTDSLPVVTDKVLTSLIYSVYVIFNNASEFDIIDGQTNAAVEPAPQLSSSYNSCKPLPVATILPSEDNSAMCYGQYFVRINTDIPLLVNIIATFTNGGSYLSEEFLTGGNKKTANVINEEITGMTFYSFGINGANSGSALNNSSITVTITSVATGAVLSSHTFNRLHADTPC